MAEMYKDSVQLNVAVETQELKKSFVVGKEPYPALRGISVQIYDGNFTIIYGPSGSGKSTLLNCIIGLEPPTSGKIWVAGQRIDLMTEDERAEMRAAKFGVVSQQPIWIKALTVLENVALPLLLQGVDKKEAKERSLASLQNVGMESLAKHKPVEISGGQQQRVSLARALVHNPQVLILDEPTGNLDTHSSDQVLQLLHSLNKDFQRTIIMVTHNLVYLPYANQTIALTDGLINEIKNATGQIMSTLKGAG